MKKLYLSTSVILISFVIFIVQAQSEDSTQQKSFRVSGFIDAYYAYDFNQPTSQERPNFFFNHNRHNEFNINIALIQLDYEADRYRGRVGLMAGTYPEYNYAAEQDLLKHIFEAYGGFRLVEGLWLDAGIFSSNIGYESAISSDNYTLTRSIGAEISPYYLAGVRLTYEPSEKWNINAILCNGWQNIRETPGNSKKALSLQVQFKPSSSLSLGNTVFIGNEEPDELGQMRYYNNFYVNLKPTERLSLFLGFDYGAEEALEEGFDTWLTTVAVIHYQFIKELAMAARYEYYEDPQEVLVSTPQGFGFQTSAYSLNLDYRPVPKVLLRVEGRLFSSPDQIFSEEESLLSDQNFSITSSLAISF